MSQDYKNQGDFDFYTEQALQARRNLRHDPEVVSWLGRFFETFVSSDKHGMIARSELIAVQVQSVQSLTLT